MEYEVSLLPPDTVFPRVGQIWETVRECVVDATIFLGNGEAMAGHPRLKAPERFRITGLSNPPIMVSFTPLRYEELEKLVVPEEFLTRQGYGGYQLDLRFGKERYFNELFKLVSNPA